MKLTEAQIKILEDAFSNYTEYHYEFARGTDYGSMEGISKQLEKLGDKSGYIFYIDNTKNSTGGFDLNKIWIGNTPEVEDCGQFSPEMCESLKTFHGIPDSVMDELYLSFLETDRNMRVELENNTKTATNY
jgi:hypothetical protein